MANVPGLDYGVKPVHDPTKRDSVLRFETNQPQRSSWFSRGGSGIIGSVISAGAGLLDSALNRRYAKRADKLNYERYLEERRYNSPAAAAARMRAAGLDPRAVTGQIASAAAASGTPQFDDPGTGGSIASGGLAAAQNLVAAGQMDIDSMRQAVEAEKAQSEMYLSSKSAERIVEEIKGMPFQRAILQSQATVESVMSELQTADVSFDRDSNGNLIVTGGTLYLEYFAEQLKAIREAFNFETTTGVSMGHRQELYESYERSIFVDVVTSMLMAVAAENGEVLPYMELRNAIAHYANTNANTAKTNKETSWLDVNNFGRLAGAAISSIIPFGKLFKGGRKTYNFVKGGFKKAVSAGMVVRK